jgi:hypothetical protein
MKPMRAKRGPKWRLRLATALALLRERNFQMDTIPKPGGLGFASALRTVAVQLSSSICPAFVPVLSTSCSPSARSPE